MPYRKTAHFRIDSIAGLLLLIALFVVLFYVVKGVLTILVYAAPVLLIAAFIIERAVVINYVKWLGGLVKSNPLLGAGAIALSLVGYIFVFPYLFFKALFIKKVKDVKERHEREKQGELIDFEEIESKPNMQETLKLPKVEEQEIRKERNTYDKLFD